MKQSERMSCLFFSLKRPWGLLVAASALFAPPASAEDISYPTYHTLTTINATGSSLAPSGDYGAFGSSKSYSLSGNTVTVESDIPWGKPVAIYGAVNSKDTDALTNNQVIINGGGASGSVYGASGSTSNAAGAAVIGNSVIFRDGTVGQYIYGGSSSTAAATGNSVLIDGSNASGKYVYGGGTTTGAATSNSVTINNGSVLFIQAGYAASTGAVSNNLATINGGEVTSDVRGGNATSGPVTNNNVIINGGVIGDATPGNGKVYGGSINGTNGPAIVTGNSVAITGGTIKADVYGGHKSSTTVANLNRGTITGNSVAITGGEIKGNIYGGYSAGIGLVQNNSVTLGGGIIRGSVYGGYGGDDFFAGNALNVTAADLTVGGDLKNFEYLNFYVPAHLTANSAMLNVIGEADLTGSSGRSSVVNVGVAGGSSPLQKNDKIVLIQAGTLTTNSGLNATADGQGMQGISLKYKFNIETVANQLLAIVTSADVNPQNKALLEGRAAEAGFLTQGADMLTSVGMQAMQGALDQCNAAQGGCDRNSTAFGVVQGSTQRIETGSHVDVDGLSLLAGVARKNAFALENLTVGAFIEAGWGNYNSTNNFSTAPSVYGDGDTTYYGAGLMGKLDMAHDIYLDASLRAGRVDVDFKSNDIAGIPAHYDSASTYYGASTGLGKIVRLDEQQSVDVYGRYLWTHIGSDTVTIAGDPFTFDAINSHRVRAGARYGNQFSPTYSFYAGAAYDYELDGDAKGSVYGYRMDAPSLKGGTGIFELGMALHPQNNDRLRVDVGVQGYVGQREGVTGGVKLNYAF